MYIVAKRWLPPWQLARWLLVDSCYSDVRHPIWTWLWLGEALRGTARKAGEVDNPRSLAQGLPCIFCMRTGIASYFCPRWGRPAQKTHSSDCAGIEAISIFGHCRATLGIFFRFSGWRLCIRTVLHFLIFMEFMGTFRPKTIGTVDFGLPRIRRIVLHC